MKNRISLVVFIVVVLLVNLTVWLTVVNALHSDAADCNEVYLICDVYDVVYNGEMVEIDMLLPNGELLTRQMSINDDLPEGFSEIIVKTDDLDNYSTYEIVGMR